MIHELKTFTDPRGSLTVAEIEKDIPFLVRRAFWIYDVPDYQQRGRHANKEIHEFLVVLKGKVEISLENKDGIQHYCLDSPDKGLHVSPFTWIELHYFSPDAVLLVLSSHSYQPDTYINSYEEFLNIIGK